MSDFIEMRQIVTMVLRRWKLIVVIVALFGTAGFLYSLSRYPVYEATASVLVGRSLQGGNLSSNDIEVEEHLASTYATLGRRQPVLEGALNELGIDMSWRQLRGRVRISPVEDTQLLEISVESTSPAVARMLADEIARQMILLSPANSQSPQQMESRRFLESRLDSLQQRIEDGQFRIAELESEMTGLRTTAEITTHQNEIHTLEQMITNWESNYAQLSSVLDSSGTEVNTLTIVEPATVNPNPVRPRTELNIALGGMLGLVLSLGLVLVSEYVDDSLRTTDDVERVLGLTSLGEVSSIVGKDYQIKLLSAQGPFSSVSEAFNTIRSNIRFLSGGREPSVVLVTSAGVGEGKSLTVANLALATTRRDVRTIVVDADLRRPRQHKIFGKERKAGLAELLALVESEPDFRFEPESDSQPESDSRPETDSQSETRVKLEDYVMELGDGKPDLLAAGKTPDNPSELLSKDAMMTLLTRLLGRYEMVILDSPPILNAADAAIMSTMVDAVVLVVHSGSTTYKDGRRALAQLEQAGARVLGAVLNNVSEHAQSYGYGPYGPTDEEEGEERLNYKEQLRHSYLRVGRLVRGARAASNGQQEGRVRPGESISDTEV